jgi:hypothetical protein
LEENARIVLMGHMGMSQTDCHLLRDIWTKMRAEGWPAGVVEPHLRPPHGEDPLIAAARIRVMSWSNFRREADYLNTVYNRLRPHDFITPLLEAFGWDVTTLQPAGSIPRGDRGGHRRVGDERLSKGGLRIAAGPPAQAVR